jgi:hypothetical protein
MTSNSKPKRTIRLGPPKFRRGKRARRIGEPWRPAVRY